MDTGVSLQERCGHRCFADRSHQSIISIHSFLLRRARASAGVDARDGPRRAILDCNSDRIRRSHHASCIIRTTVGPVRPVVPGDGCEGHLVPPE